MYASCNIIIKYICVCSHIIYNYTLTSAPEYEHGRTGSDIDT